MEPKLPPLPLDLDNSPARMSIQIKAGDLVRLLHQWGREVYAAGQAAATAASAGGAK